MESQRSLLLCITSNYIRSKISISYSRILFLFQDLVVHRSLDSVLEILPNIWRDIFRLMDDVKESCRLAAAKTVTSLTRACVKMCDVTQFPKSGEVAIKAILPALVRQLK